MATYEFIRIKDKNSNGILSMVKSFRERILSSGSVAAIARNDVTPIAVLEGFPG